MKTLFTERQVEIAKLLYSGESMNDISKKLGITVQDVSITAKRFRENLEKAFNTVNFARDLSFSGIIAIESGTHILDAARRIINEADRLEIKLRDNTVSLVNALRSYLGKELKNGVSTDRLQIALMKDGTIRVF
jgi:Tfx family DNA-binding protein